ncbi:MAG: hypothetical protein Q8K60_07160, partial [Parachlamydiaceae bacterium]|nr:hypothetical protein [Parachlamydiaceae bacterium]
MNIHSLQLLFCQQVGEHSSSFEKGVYRFLHFQEYPSDGFLENECVWEEPLFSEERAIKNWKCLLSANVLCELAQLDTSLIAQQVKLFEQRPWNQSSQYFRSIVALNHAFAKMLVPEVGPHLLESGAALIDLYEYTPWLSLPYTPQHFEFGIFLAVLGLLKGKQELKEIVVRLAKWQINTLDIHGCPLKGLFVKEKESQSPRSQSLSYLLFRVASLCSNDYPFAEYAEAALKSLFEKEEYASEVIDPLWALIEKWCESFPLKTNANEPLSEYIYDPSTALVGFRAVSEQIMCTLHGGKTGLGSIRKDDVEIVSYGPQYFPLADCEGFGIQGNALSDQGM